MISFWRRSGSSSAERKAAPATPVVPQERDPVILDMDAELKRDFADVYQVCREATDEVLALLPGGGYERLGLHSPGLEGYDWRAYINLSMLRQVRVARALKKYVAKGGKVLDFGSYFGNFGLAAQKVGFEVTALDSYGDYSPALKRERQHLEMNGIRVLDSSSSRTLLDELGETFDAILLLGVIEHIPHTPKQLLEHLVDKLAPGGNLIVDTPNLAYVYKREAAAAGLSTLPPINLQFDCPPPFEGHHREYTQDELHWMLRRLDLEIIEAETFNFSIYSQTSLIGEDAVRFMRMRHDPLLREVLYAVARSPSKQAAGKPHKRQRSI